MTKYAIIRVVAQLTFNFNETEQEEVFSRSELSTIVTAAIRNARNEINGIKADEKYVEAKGLLQEKALSYCALSVSDDESDYALDEIGDGLVFTMELAIEGQEGAGRFSAALLEVMRTTDLRKVQPATPAVTAATSGEMTSLTDVNDLIDKWYELIDLYLEHRISGLPDNSLRSDFSAWLEWYTDFPGAEPFTDYLSHLVDWNDPSICHNNLAALVLDDLGDRIENLDTDTRHAIEDLTKAVEKKYPIHLNPNVIYMSEWQPLIETLDAATKRYTAEQNLGKHVGNTEILKDLLTNPYRNERYLLLLCKEFSARYKLQPQQATS